MPVVRINDTAVKEREKRQRLLEPVIRVVREKSNLGRGFITITKGVKAPNTRTRFAKPT